MEYTNEKLLEMFENSLKGEKKSNNTIEKYLRDVNEFLNNINKSVKEIKRIDIKMYLGQKSNLSSSTISGILSSLKSFFSFLVLDLELLESDCTYSIKAPKVKNRTKKTLTIEKAETLVDYSKNVRDRAIIYLLINSGIRVSELINLTLTQYNNRDEDDCITLLCKGDKLGDVYLSERAIEYINDYLKVRKESEFDNLFISNQNGKMDRQSMSRTWKTLARRSGIFNAEEISCISNHLMRATCATLLSDNGTPIETVQQVLHHSSPSTTARYIKVNKDRVKMAMGSNIF